MAELITGAEATFQGVPITSLFGTADMPHIIRPVERCDIRRFTLEVDGAKVTLVPLDDVLALLDREYELTESEPVGRLARVIRQATGIA